MTDSGSDDADDGVPRRGEELAVRPRLRDKWKAKRKKASEATGEEEKEERRRRRRRRRRQQFQINHPPSPLAHNSFHIQAFVLLVSAPTHNGSHFSFN